MKTEPTNADDVQRNKEMASDPPIDDAPDAEDFAFMQMLDSLKEHGIGIPVHHVFLCNEAARELSSMADQIITPRKSKTRDRLHGYATAIRWLVENHRKLAQLCSDMEEKAKDGEINEWKFAALCSLAGLVTTPQSGYRGPDGLEQFRLDYERMRDDFKTMKNAIQRIAQKNEWFMSPDGSRKWKSDSSFSDLEVKELCKLVGCEIPEEVGT